jgi:hypothetical protein
LFDLAKRLDLAVEPAHQVGVAVGGDETMRGDLGLGVESLPGVGAGDLTGLDGVVQGDPAVAPLGQGGFLGLRDDCTWWNDHDDLEGWRSGRVMVRAAVDDQLVCQYWQGFRDGFRLYRRLFEQVLELGFFVFFLHGLPLCEAATPRV